MNDELVYALIGLSIYWWMGWQAFRNLAKRGHLNNLGEEISALLAVILFGGFVAAMTKRGESAVITQDEHEVPITEGVRFDETAVLICCNGNVPVGDVCLLCRCVGMTATDPAKMCVTHSKVTQCFRYSDQGGCFHPDGRGHEGNCLSKQVADQLDKPVGLG